MATEFPLKTFKEVVKTAGKYFDNCYVNEDGLIRCNSNDIASIGKFIVFPKVPDNIGEFAPFSFKVTSINKDLQKLKAKSLQCDILTDEIYLHDDSGLGVSLMKCDPFYNSEFIEFIWSRLNTYNFTELSPSEFDKLEDGQIVALPAYFNDENKAPLKLLISGKEFSFVKALVGISIAAVEKETAYQQHLDHSHVVLRIEYDYAVVFILCGVV